MIRRKTIEGDMASYKFVGWVEDTEEFKKIIDNKIKSSEVINYIFDTIVEKAKQQALHLNPNFRYGDGYIDYIQQQLENIGKLALEIGDAYFRNSGEEVFVSSIYTSGIYVFKKYY